MAEIRFNYGDKFTQTSDSNTGIGSTIPAGKLDIAGGTSAGSLRVSGIATLSSYQGFVNTKLTPTENIIVEAGQSGSVSGEVVVSTGQTISVSTGATTGQGGIQSLKVYETFMPPVGGTADRPTDVKPGMVYYNKDFKTIEFWDGNFWKQVDNTTRSSRAVIATGLTPLSPAASSVMMFLNITNLGNAQNFGDLTVTRMFSSGNSSSTRGIFGGGDPGPSNSDVIDYITIASEGNAIDFGNLLAAGRCFAGASSSTRGLHFGEGGTPSGTNVISYSEIATLGNALDFGDLTSQNGNKGTAASSPTRYVFHTQNNSKATIDFGTIAAKGNSTRFGDYISGGPGHPAAALLRCCSNQTRAVFAGGYLLISPYGFVTPQMGAITIASEGNATVFGDLTVARYGVSATSNQVRGVFAGGQGGNPYPYINTIDFITFASSGNAQDFGDIDSSVGSAVSDSHGGLGGF
jgi:hypothetical protein